MCIYIYIVTVSNNRYARALTMRMFFFLCQVSDVAMTSAGLASIVYLLDASFDWDRGGGRRGAKYARTAEHAVGW